MIRSHLRLRILIGLVPFVYNLKRYTLNEKRCPMTGQESHPAAFPFWVIAPVVMPNTLEVVPDAVIFSLCDLFHSFVLSALYPWAAGISRSTAAIVKTSSFML